MVITSVQPGSPAADAGLSPGSVILSVNHQPVANVDDLARAVGEAEGDSLLMHIKREGGSRFVVVKRVI